MVLGAFWARGRFLPLQGHFCMQGSPPPGLPQSPAIAIPHHNHPKYHTNHQVPYGTVMVKFGIGCILGRRAFPSPTGPFLHAGLPTPRLPKDPSNSHTPSHSPKVPYKSSGGIWDCYDEIWYWVHSGPGGVSSPYRAIFACMARNPQPSHSPQQ